MIDNKTIYSEHPFYNQFVKWSGLELNSENYFMINTALFGAEDYISQRFDIKLSPINIIEHFDTNTHPRYRISKLLNVMSNTLLLPSVRYYNKTTNEYENVDGQYSFNDSLNVTEDSTITYLTGYIGKQDITFDVQPSGTFDNKAPLQPLIYFNDILVDTPIYTLEDTIEVVVEGEIGSNIYVNEKNTTINIGDDGTATISLNINSRITTYRITLVDTMNNVSERNNILILKQENQNILNLILLGQELVTNNNELKVSIYLSESGNLIINGLDKGMYTKGIHEIIVDNLDGSYIILQLVNDNRISDDIVIPYSIVTYDDNYVKAVNKHLLDIPYIPMDLLIAFFKLTQHLYHSTLYKDDNIDRYSAGTSKSISFTSHRIPKDILEVLSLYIEY